MTAHPLLSSLARVCGVWRLTSDMLIVSCAVASAPAGPAWRPANGMHTALGTLLRYGASAFTADGSSAGGDQSLPPASVPSRAGAPADSDDGAMVGQAVVSSSSLSSPGILHVQVAAVRGLASPSANVRATMKLSPWMTASAKQGWATPAADGASRLDVLGTHPCRVTDTGVSQGSAHPRVLLLFACLSPFLCIR